MDRKLNSKIAEYISGFKKDIKNKVLLLDFKEKDKIEELIEYIFEFDRLELTEEDVSKRKRIKNSIPSVNRCLAKRANGQQCTRTQKETEQFCGTHMKGTPHGVLNDENSKQEDKIIIGEVFAHEIGGIVYYLDKFNNVFVTEDIMNNNKNPRVLTQYIKEDDAYHIPSLGV